MDCQQLVRLVKDWYLSVKQEAMAPVRMMQFVDQHVKTCPICKKDLILPEEIEKIRGYLLPETKTLKAVRSPGDSSTPEISPEDEEDPEEEDEVDEESDEDPVDEDEEDELDDDDVI